MHVERDVHKLLRDALADDVALLVGGVLEQLLAEIVPERVRHEVREVPEGLAEDHVAVLGEALLELLLQVPAAVLVLAQRGDLALEVLEPRACEAVD